MVNEIQDYLQQRYDFMKAARLELLAIRSSGLSAREVKHKITQAVKLEQQSPHLNTISRTYRKIDVLKLAISVMFDNEPPSQNAHRLYWKALELEGKSDALKFALENLNHSNHIENEIHNLQDELANPPEVLKHSHLKTSGPGHYKHSYFGELMQIWNLLEKID
ncbi:MAG: hypothetical protein AAF614_27295 [Chloroflexota bacterium]